MSRFDFDANLLEAAERHRQPLRRRAAPDATPEEIDRQTKFDRAHRTMLREEFLLDADVRFADSRGWMVAKKPSSIKAMFFGTTKDADHGVLPPPLARLEEATVRLSSFRSGPGAGIPEAILVHAALPLAELQAAANVLKTYGLRPERLPFSFVNPRGAFALLIVKATKR